MPLNPDAVGSTTKPGRRSSDSKDALLYALGIGCGVNDLAFVIVIAGNGFTYAS